MMKAKIPFNIPFQSGGEIADIKRALAYGQLSGDGVYTQRCSHFLKNYLGVHDVLLTTSCTHALELAYLLLDIKTGDEVILPSFTFPSTANAFVLRGAKPRFVDIRPDTLNIDENLIEEKITSKVKAISPVHYAGVPCEMDAINKIARKHRLWVVEDAAQALGARLRGRLCGTFGHLNAFSFHETKNLNCGEGGALAFPEKRFIKRAEIIRQKGTNRAQFYRGEVDKYSWVDIGSSYVPSELQTAFLFAQLKHHHSISVKRKKLFCHYWDGLKFLEEKGIARLPVIPTHVESSHHLFHLIFPTEKWRDKVLAWLRKNGIYAVFHYVPLHVAEMGRKFGYRIGDCPVTESFAPRLLRLPLFNSMTGAEQDFVINTLTRYFL